MEQVPKARDREPEKVKAGVNPAKAAKDPAQIPAVDQEAAKVGDRAEAKVPDKAGIKAVPGENKISNIHERKITV